MFLVGIEFSEAIIREPVSKSVAGPRKKGGKGRVFDVLILKTGQLVLEVAT